MFFSRTAAARIRVSAAESDSSYSTWAVRYAGILRPVRCSRLRMARSRQIDWIELNSPIQMQAQMTAKAPFFVSLKVTNISSPVTRLIKRIMISVLIRFFHCFSA